MTSKVMSWKRFSWAILLLILLLSLVIAACGGGSFTLRRVEVPINLDGASNLGSLSLELEYDSSVLEIAQVHASELAANAMMEYNTTTPGLLALGLIDSSGINGDGPLVIVRFNVLGSEGNSTLALDNVEAHDATTLIDIRVKATAGSFEDRSASPPMLTFNP